MKSFLVGLGCLLLGEFFWAIIPGSGWGALTLFPLGCISWLVSTIILFIRCRKAGIIFLLFLVSAIFQVYTIFVFLLYCFFILLAYIFLYYFHKGRIILLLMSLMVCVSVCLGVVRRDHYNNQNIVTRILYDLEYHAAHCAGFARYTNVLSRDGIESILKKCSDQDTEVVLKHIPQSLCKYMISEGVEKRSMPSYVICPVGVSDYKVEISKIVLNGDAFLKENCQSDNDMYFYLKVNIDSPCK